MRHRWHHASCVKHNFLVRDVKDLAETMRRAFYIARTGRPGPVLVDIPKDVTVAQCKYAPPKGEITMRSYAPVNKGTRGRSRRPCRCCWPPNVR